MTYIHTTTITTTTTTPLLTCYRANVGCFRSNLGTDRLNNAHTRNHITRKYKITTYLESQTPSFPLAVQLLSGCDEKPFILEHFHC